MKVLIVNLDKRGIMHYAINLANNLLIKCDEVFVLGYTPIDKYLNKKIRIFTLFSRSFIQTFKLFKKIIITDRPNIIHFTNFHPYFIYFVFYAKKYKIPTVLTVHDANRHPSTNRKFFKRIYSSLITNKILIRFLISSVSKVIALSDYVGKGIKVLYKIKPEIILFSCDILRYQKYLNSTNSIDDENSPLTIKLLFFGTIDKYKGIEYLIKACEILKNRDIYFYLKIAGDSYSYNLKIPSVLKENIVYENHFISENEIPSLFLNSDLVILPYIEVSQSGILPMAFAFGKPVIATNIGSFPEIVEDGINGFLVSPKSPEEIAQKISTLYKNRNLLSKLAKNAIETYNKKLKWSHLVDRYIDIYKHLIT